MTIFICLILFIANKNLNTGFFIRIPSNYLLLPEFTPEREQKDLLKNAKNSIDNVCDFIKNDKKTLKVKVINKRTRHFERINLNFQKKALIKTINSFLLMKTVILVVYMKKFIL